MQFKVPKFLEREAKIIGPLTFKQFAYFGVAALVLLFLYFVLSPSVFFICVFLIGGLAFSLVFIKTEGVPLGQVLPHYFGFLISSRTYLWQKKEVLTPIKLVEKKEQKKKEKAAPLKVAPESRLRKLSSKINVGLK